MPSAQLARNTVGLMVLALLGAGVAGCTSTTNGVHTNPDSTRTSSRHSTAAASKKVAHVGDTITLKQNSASIALTLVKVDPNVKAKEPDIDTPSAGNRYYGVQFRIVNNSSAATQGDPFNDITVQDAQGQNFDTTILGGGITDGPLFLSNTNLAANGGKALGWAVLEVPEGDTITQAQFTLNSGFGQSAQWAIP